MAETSWSQLYDEAKSGIVAGIAEGPYDVEVADARPNKSNADSRTLFLDLTVLSGPLAGKTAQVNLYLPEAGNRGAGFHFRNKIMGFGDLTETFRQMDNTQEVAEALEILADAVKGRRVTADIELRSDGEYAGTNQLAKTKPVSDAQAPPQVTDAQTVTAANVAPIPPAVAEAVAARVANAPEPAMAGEVPF